MYWNISDNRMTNKNLRLNHDCCSIFYLSYYNGQTKLYPSLIYYVCIDRVGDKSIGQFLRYAFTSRYKEVLSKAHSSSTMTVPKFATRLTKEEAQGTDTSPLHLLIPPFVSPYHINYSNLG
jgi:hypothetical protein